LSFTRFGSIVRLVFPLIQRSVNAPNSCAGFTSAHSQCTDSSSALVLGFSLHSKVITPSKRDRNVRGNFNPSRRESSADVCLSFIAVIVSVMCVVLQSHVLTCQATGLHMKPSQPYIFTASTHTHAHAHMHHRHFQPVGLFS